MNKQIITISLVFVILHGINFYVEQKNEDKFLAKIDAKIEEVNKNIDLNNITQNNILDHHGRLLHYISGHNSSKFVFFCPECALLKELNIRVNKIDDRIHELSEFLALHPEDPTFAEKQKEIIALTEESVLANQKIFSADERAKELSKIITNMRAK